MAIMYKEQKFNIHTTHCDFQDYLRPSAALDFFQDLACTNADETGVGFDHVRSLGYIWVVMYEQFEVITRIPKFGEQIIVKTWPKPRGRLEFEREYEICDAEGNLAIKGISNWTLIDINKRTISRAENVVFQGEYLSKTNYPEKQKRRLNLKSDHYDLEYHYKVLLSDLDHNLHMNNAKYLDIIHNMQSMNHYKLWKKVEIAFIHEARLNDEITIKHYHLDDKECYQGYVNGNACFEAIVYLEA